MTKQSDVILCHVHAPNFDRMQLQDHVYFSVMHIV